jgi:hypothetical protein
MKTHVLRTWIIALLVAAAGHAQSPRQLSANIPFSFVAGRATLNAGQYIVDQSNPGLIQIKSANGRPGAFLLTATGHCAGNQPASKLVFHRYGDTYLLSQIWTRGDNYGRQTLVTGRERELAARYRAPDETIFLAMR